MTKQNQNAAPLEVMTTDEAANFLRVKKSWLENSRRAGAGNPPPFVRMGGLVRYRRADLEQWLINKAVKAAN